MWHRLFGPKNSLILTFDKANLPERDELEDQLDHVSAYYQFAPLSQIVGELKHLRAGGLAAVVFLAARKSLFLKILPELQARGIPVTIFADPDLIGTNRLAPREEVAVYQKKFPELLLDSPLANARALGQLPVELADPLDFSVTWGKISEVPASLREMGISVSSPLSENEFCQNLKFLSQRVGSAAKFAYGKPLLSTMSDNRLQGFGIEAVVGNSHGQVDKKTSCFDLPQFFFEKTL